MPSGLRNHGLGLFFGAIFLVALIGQAVVGHADFNHLQAAHRGDAMGFWRYVTSSDFGADVLENWQSEYLQFTLYILTTVWLLQRGSPESKELDKAGRESDEEQKLGEHADARSPRWARGGGWGARGSAEPRLARARVRELAADRDDRDLARLVGRPVRDRPRRLQRGAVRPPAGRGELAPVRRQQRLLEPDAAELAVRVPGRRLDGRALDLPAPARLAGIQARGRASRRHQRRGVGGQSGKTGRRAGGRRHDERRDGRGCRSRRGGAAARGAVESRRLAARDFSLFPSDLRAASPSEGN